MRYVVIVVKKESINDTKDFFNIINQISHNTDKIDNTQITKIIQTDHHLLINNLIKYVHKKIEIVLIQIYQSIVI